jgi:hypothetical protein
MKLGAEVLLRMIMIVFRHHYQKLKLKTRKVITTHHHGRKYHGRKWRRPSVRVWSMA